MWKLLQTGTAIALLALGSIASAQSYTAPPPDAPSPSPQPTKPPVNPAQENPFPGDSPSQPAKPASNPRDPYPDADTPRTAPPPPSAPANAAKDNPFPEEAPQPRQQPAPGGGFSSSSDANPYTAPDAGDPAQPAKPEIRQKLELHDPNVHQLDTARAEEDERVADFYIKDGNYKGAYLRYKDAVLSDPDDPEAHFALAEIAKHEGNSAEAIEHYGAYLRLDPQGKKVKAARAAVAELVAKPAKPAK